MKDVVKSFTESKNNLLNYFNCKDNYFTKDISDYKWRVKEFDNAFFLTYWKNEEKIRECVLIKKEGNPLLYEKSDYTLIIGIECVKIAFILKNSNQA